MAVLTIYNFGTNSFSGDSTVTAYLAKYTTSPLKFINEGVGSGGKFLGFGRHQNPGDKNRISGMLWGVGTDAAVEAAVKEVERCRNNPYLKLSAVNMCGWSRGGITCFKVANRLYKDPLLRHLPVRMFVFDPVPGSNWGSGHMWRDITINPNVEKAVIIVAQHERRREFAPALPQANGRDIKIDLFPGNHSSILTLKPKESHNAAFHINLDRAIKFLTKAGTQFSYTDLLSDQRIVELYSDILAHWENFQELKQARPGSARRTVKDLRGVKIAKLTVGTPLATKYFVNVNHHEKLFRKLYPALHAEITSATGFSDGAGNWVGELDAISTNPETRWTWTSVVRHMQDKCPEMYHHVLGEN